MGVSNMRIGFADPKQGVRASGGNCKAAVCCLGVRQFPSRTQAKYSPAIIRSCFDCRIKFSGGDASAHVLFSDQRGGRISLFLSSPPEKGNKSFCGPRRAAAGKNVGAERR